MDADTSGHSADSICSDDTEYLLGQNISIREIDDDDLHIHELNAKGQSPQSRLYDRSPQHSPQKLQQVNSANLRSPLRKELKSKPGKGLHEFQRSPGHSTTKQPTTGKSSMAKAKRKPDNKLKVAHGYLGTEVVRGHSEQAKGKTSYKTKTMKSAQDLDQVAKGKTAVTDNFAKQQQNQSFQSPENYRASRAQAQGPLKVSGSPNMKSEPHYNSASRLTPSTRDKSNAKRNPTAPSRLLVQQNVPVNQDNWELDSEISLDMVNAVRNTGDVEPNDLESDMSEATEDLIREEDVDDEDLTEKLKELNLAVNYDIGTNGE